MLWILLGILIIFCGIFLLWCCISIIKNGEHVTGNICEIANGSSGMGGSAHNIIVEFNQNGETVKHYTLDFFFLTPFFKKRQLARLRKKHVGRQVHIYYNPANELQALIREYMWKDFLMALFLIFLGCTPILASIMNWY